MKTAMSPTMLAHHVAQTSGVPVVLVQAASLGGQQHLVRTLPSLDDSALETLAEEGMVALTFENAAEAASAFNRLSQDAIEKGAMVAGTIRLVRPGAQGTTVVQIHAS